MWHNVCNDTNSGYRCCCCCCCLEINNLKPSTATGQKCPYGKACWYVAFNYSYCDGFPLCLFLWLRTRESQFLFVNSLLYFKCNQGYSTMDHITKRQFRSNLECWIAFIKKSFNVFHRPKRYCCTVVLLQEMGDVMMWITYSSAFLLMTWSCLYVTWLLKSLLFIISVVYHLLKHQNCIFLMFNRSCQ